MKRQKNIQILAGSLFTLLLIVQGCESIQEKTLEHNKDGIKAAGEFSPLGPPLKEPERIEAGQSCIVDLIQPYTISGTLSGKIVFNYRILVKGPCGSPPGTYDEEWIAYGEFTGKLDNADVSGKMCYTANVEAGVEVNGIIVLGQGLEGKLQVHANVKDRKLLYQGYIK